MNHPSVSFINLLNVCVFAPNTRRHTSLSSAPPGRREGDPPVNKYHSLKEATDSQTDLSLNCLTSPGAGVLFTLPVLFESAATHDPADRGQVRPPPAASCLLVPVIDQQKCFRNIPAVFLCNCYRSHQVALSDLHLLWQKYIQLFYISYVFYVFAVCFYKPIYSVNIPTYIILFYGLYTVYLTCFNNL